MNASLFARVWIALAIAALALGESTPPVTRTVAPPGSSVVTVYDLSASGTNTNGDLLGVRHALDAFGIPYRVTSDHATALAAPEMLVIAGTIDSSIPSNTRKRLRTDLPLWVMRPGHTLWASAIKDTTLLAGLGLALAGESDRRGKVLVPGGSAIDRYVDAVEEHEIWLAQYTRSPDTFTTTRAYQSSGSPYWSVEVLASYEDGRAAVVSSRDRVSGGRVVLLGVRFRDLLTRMENQLNLSHTRGAANAFDPSADVVRLWLKASYESWTLAPFLRPAAPDGKRAAVILTHDIDATTAFSPLQSLYYPLEMSYASPRVRSTLFVTTSYRHNHWIGPFYVDPANQAILAWGLSQGFDIQSHSVSHLPDMSTWPAGAAIDDPALYAPEYDTKTGKTTGGAVRPEMLISARLLREDLGVVVRGWRSGELARPAGMGALLAECGYWYDSDHLSGRVGGSFPYLMLTNFVSSGTEVPVLEIPLSISDGSIETRTAEETTALWYEYTMKNAANGSPTVILVHPTKPELKYAPYSAYLARIVAEGDLWIGSMEEWYAWYRAQGIRSEQ